MRKALFLLGRHKLYNLNELKKSNANELMVVWEEIEKQKLKELRTLHMKIGLSIGAFKNDTCPLNPESKSRLKKLINQLLDWQPQTIWFDHFRFDGHWEAMRRNQLDGEHQPCKWCKGKDKVKELIKIARLIKTQVHDRAEIGFFAVPFKATEVLPIIDEMGQDVQQLGQIFDVISPMLYHRMIEKPVGYISDFTAYLSHLTAKPVLPIIQIKDLPDSLPDKFTEAQIIKTFHEAARSPSAGVAWFCWDDAIETNKTYLIERLFNT